MSEGTPQDTQDSQAGSHELLVSGVKRKAVESVASAGQPFVGRTGSIEEAGVGNKAVPNAQEVLNFIALKHFKIVDPSKPEESNGFLQYLKDVRKVLVLDVQPGSLILTALCSSMEILDALWYDYCTGNLNDMAQKYLVTKDVLKEFDLTELKLTTTIQGEEYLDARKFLLQGSEKYPNTSLKRKRTDGNEQAKSVQGGTSVSEDNKELNQLHSAERDSDVTRMKSTPPLERSVDSRNATGITPLMNAAMNGNVQAVKLLIERGADPSLKDNSGLNSLHFATIGGDTNIISLIHTRMPDIESLNGKGETPLLVAAYSGKLHAVKWFLERGANATYEDKGGWNALHSAASSGDPETIDHILTHVPNIESKTAVGETALIIAVHYHTLQGVKRLLERGANPLAKDNEGQDSLHHASLCDSDLLDLALNHVANSESTTGND